MIILVNPYLTSAQRYGSSIGDIGGHQMPLGIFYLAAYLEKHGEKASIIDAEAQGLGCEAVVAEILRLRARIVGITATTVGFGNARLLAQRIKEKDPRISIVIGGPHMSAMPEETMRYAEFDFGIAREGEAAFLQLVRYLRYRTGTLAEIANLYYRQGPNIVKPKTFAVIENLDDIPFPARSLCADLSVYKPPVGAYRKKPVASVITSRGCPYRCSFCDNNTFGRKVRYFSAAYVAREIMELVGRYGVREIAFLDDTFILNKDRLYAIFERLTRERIVFPWTCMTRANNLEYDTLKFMKENGCWQIRIGIESGNQKVLDFIMKDITLEQVQNVAAWCKELRIHVTGFFMLGHHIDTPSTIQDTIDFALALPLTDVTATLNTPVPGTESYEKALASGRYTKARWDELNYWTPVFVPDGLTGEYLLQKQAELYRRFYTRLDVLLRQWSKVRSFESLGMLAKNAVLGLLFILKRQGARGLRP